MHVPTWVCLPVAAIAFAAVKFLIAKLATGQALLEAMAVQYGNWMAGFFAVIVLLAGITAEIKKRLRRRLLEKQQGLDTVRALSWLDFELLVGEAYRRLGYQVTETGGGGADGGIDLKLRNGSGQVLLVQCKQWRVYKVGVRPIRELYGVLTAEGADCAIFVTTGTYTEGAKSFALGKPIELVDGEKLALLIAPLRGLGPKHPAPEEPVQTLNVTFPVAVTVTEAPACPVCQSEMVLRTARRGSNAGSQFWGCCGYPTCRGTREAVSARGEAKTRR